MVQTSFLIGLQALRVNPLRTLLSTLGVIMGVGALVSVLSMGDGVEKFSREQLARTTDLLAVELRPESSRRVDGQLLPRADTVQFALEDAEAAARWPGVAAVEVLQRSPALAQRSGAAERRGVLVFAGTPSMALTHELRLARGAFFDAGEARSRRRVVVLSATLDAALGGPAVGDSIMLNDVPFAVRGVLAVQDTADKSLRAFAPLGTVPSIPGAPQPGAPSLVVKARDLEDVAGIKKSAEAWLAGRVGPAWKERVSVRANDDRRAQAQQAMFIFKILMGAITGVSLLVGGVGIMNVLLASVAERTREIGLRKALGARNGEILMQFLAESVAITSAGAALGTVLGVAVAMLAAWVMRQQTGAPVQASVTLATVLVAVGASVTVGLGFGIYPAMRAARLSPIDAIRHE